MNATDNNHITITLADGGNVRKPLATPVQALLPDDRANNGLHYVGALVNNDVVSLTYPLETDCTVSFLTLADPNGWRMYRNSVSFLLAKAVKALYPEAHFAVEHSLGTGFYCTFELNGTAGVTKQ